MRAVRRALSVPPNRTVLLVVVTRDAVTVATVWFQPAASLFVPPLSSPKRLRGDPLAEKILAGYCHGT